MVYHIIDYLIGLFTGIFAGYGMRIIDERRKKPTKATVQR